MSTLPITAATSPVASARASVAGHAVSLAPSMPAMFAMYTDTNAAQTETPWLDVDSLDNCIKSNGFHGVERVATGRLGENLT
jgi:hypothetical protein